MKNNIEKAPIDMRQLATFYDKIPLSLCIIEVDSQENPVGSCHPFYENLQCKDMLKQNGSGEQKRSRSAGLWLDGFCDAARLYNALAQAAYDGKRTEITQYHSSWQIPLKVTCYQYTCGYAVCAIQEISENFDHDVQMDLQAEGLQRAVKAAEEANSAKTKFLSTMSHDMRTPLNVIIGMCNLANIHSDDPVKVKDCLSKINTTGNHLLMLINEVLDMSKIESGAIEFNNQEFSLSKMLKRIVFMMNDLVESRHQKLAFSLGEVSHENVSGDENKLEQIIVNIISNAVKYGKDGGSVSIYLKEEAAGDECSRYTFVVKDDGIGMSREFLKKMFEPFTREEDARVSKVVGTGLGMTITKGIVDKMGGTIQVDSEEGVGTKFTVTVPLKICKGQQESRIYSEHKVLVVDDSPEGRDSMCQALQATGAQASGVSDGREALQCLRRARNEREPYTCVMVEYSLNGCSGISLIRDIRKHIGRKLPVVLVSNIDFADIADDAFEAGANLLYSKPMFSSDFVDIFNQIKYGYDNDWHVDIVSMNGSYRGLSCILAEDNVMNAQIMKELLEYIGFRVTVASDGEAALNTFVQSDVGQYDCIFMDVQMPVMNGIEATKAIRKLDRADCGLPIFAMTANVFLEDIKGTKEAGMQEHIGKPIEMEALHKVLNKWFSEKH